MRKREMVEELEYAVERARKTNKRQFVCLHKNKRRFYVTHPDGVYEIVIGEKPVGTVIGILYGTELRNRIAMMTLAEELCKNSPVHLDRCYRAWE